MFDFVRENSYSDHLIWEYLYLLSEHNHINLFHNSIFVDIASKSLRQNGKLKKKTKIVEISHFVLLLHRHLKL